MGAAFSVPLGDEQVLFFKTFGYLVFREFFTAHELEKIHREFDYKLEEQYPGPALRRQPALLGASAR